ncbi:MAG: HAMP domain-containing histidine kinase [Oscillospiraceae bacterium]|nr:HAMP domain-containing histidine kinase [Oscillospiraceae bacterium]
MEEVRRSALRGDFIKYVLAAFFSAAVLSIVVILGCVATREWLVPSSDKVYLNWGSRGIETVPETPNYGFEILSLAEPSEDNPFYSDDPAVKKSFVLSGSRVRDNDVVMSVTRINSSPKALSQNKRFVYYASGVTMVILPIILALSAVLICGYMFYEEKLRRPIETLSAATEKISEQDLDFTVDYRSSDELGALCGSFEQMRAALRANNEEMWQMLTERRRLQASVAHDLRNPIAIIEGHAEYLKLHIQGGRSDSEKILSVADNIENAAKRLEHYTESIRAINRVEELEVKREQTDLEALFEEISEDLSTLAERGDVEVVCENSVGKRALKLDRQALYRILENVVGNALRFAKSHIYVRFSIGSDERLCVSVSDDGTGFPEKQLKNQSASFPESIGSGEHSGLGLPICRILARKHGGEIVLGNVNGAEVKIFLNVK